MIFIGIYFIFFFIKMVKSGFYEFFFKVIFFEKFRVLIVIVCFIKILRMFYIEVYVKNFFFLNLFDVFMRMRVENVIRGINE